MYNNFGNIQGAINHEREEMNRSLGMKAYGDFQGLRDMASRYGQGGAGSYEPSIDIPEDGDPIKGRTRMSGNAATDFQGSFSTSLAYIPKSGTSSACNCQCSPIRFPFGIHKQKSPFGIGEPRTAGAFAFSTDFAFGGGYSLAIGKVWDAKGNSQYFFSHGPVLGFTLSAGLSYRSITSKEGQSFNVSSYAGLGQGHSWGLFAYGGSFSGNKDSRLNPSEILFKTKGLNYNEFSNGLFVVGKFGFSWSRTNTFLF